MMLLIRMPKLLLLSLDQNSKPILRGTRTKADKNSLSCRITVLIVYSWTNEASTTNSLLHTIS